MEERIGVVNSYEFIQILNNILLLNYNFYHRIPSYG